jgi:alpha-tubulin suppressor-like RCC1 family protein
MRLQNGFFGWGAPLVLVAVGVLAFSASASASVRLYAFGDNYFGQLGSPTKNATNNANPMPALVTLPGATGTITQIAAGCEHSLALTSSGQLYTFGENYWGQLGSVTNNFTKHANPTPALVTLPGATGTITQIAAGCEHSLALTSSGQLYSFGENYWGQLGSVTNNFTKHANPTPALVTLPGANGTITQLAAGCEHSLAATSSGQLYTFGNDDSGQLGREESGTIADPTPGLVTLPGANGTITQLAAGCEHSLALTSSGQLYTFGLNYEGQLGIRTNSGTSVANPTPALVTLPGANGTITHIAAGCWHSLAATSSGQLYAFGWDFAGQLGRESGTIANPTPNVVTLPGANNSVTQIAAGCEHSLAVNSSGQLYAFGENYWGQLGNPGTNGTGNPNPTPALVNPLPGPVATLAGGSTGYDTLVVVSSAATCTTNAGTVTLSPGLTGTASVQTMNIKGTLASCAGEPFKEVEYTATLKTAGPVACSVLTAAGEPATGAAKYRWTPRAKASTGALNTLLTETPGVTFLGEVGAGGYSPTFSGTVTQSYTGAATCGQASGKKATKAVMKGTFSGSAVSYFL